MQYQDEDNSACQYVEGADIFQLVFLVYFLSVFCY